MLARHPEHADALLLRAVIEAQTDRTAESAASIRRFIERQPRHAPAHALLGDSLLKLQRPQEALASYDGALGLDPGLASAHYGRGNALLDLRRPLEALASYDRALASNPGDAEAWFNRGNALIAAKRPEEAVASYERALAARPGYAAAHGNRGSALLAQQRIAEALASFDASLALEPGCVEVLQNRGFALLRLRRLPEALAAFEQSLQLDAENADALRGRGDALLDLERPEEALASLRAAVRLAPGSADNQNSLGNALRALERLSEAIAVYDEALRLDADNAAAHYNRGTALLLENARSKPALRSYARALELDPELDYVAGPLFYGQHSRADWSPLSSAASAASIERAVLDGKRTVAPFPFLSVSDSAPAQLACARTYAAFRCSGAPLRRSGRTSPPCTDRIRVAYVSADLREHALCYLMAGVFESHDPARFETIGISLSPAESSAMGRRVARALNRFIDVSRQSDAAVCELMRGMEVDIAVDLTGFTDGFRPQIFAQRAAPIQVNYLGFPATMGADFIDYILADRFVIPPEHARYYAESVVYLPDCFQANDDRRAISARVFRREEAGLPADAFVFCCLNNTHKLNARMFDVWMRLLGAVPGSVLWLLGQDEEVRGNLRREAERRGVVSGRLVFADRVPYAEYLSRLRLADLYLDTLPFNGGTTASDVLWAGVPLLACAGEAFPARMAGSLLSALGLPELVTFTLEEYEQRALALAHRREELDALRMRLAERRSSSALFDTRRFCRHLEAAYEAMCLRERSGLPPASIIVPAIDPARPAGRVDPSG